MFHHTGTFHGIDTFSATVFGKLNYNYILFTEAKSRSIMSCPDINSHLSKLIQDDIISEFVETDKQ